MTSDADIIRCAAPWPGTAARILEALASLGPGPQSVEQVCRSTATGIDEGHALQVLTGLSIAGVCRATKGDSWQSAYDEGELRRLANILDGAEHFRRMRFASSTVELAVTMPMVPSHLEKELATSLGRPGGFLSTSSAFTRIAQAARDRLVVMTPYIDPAGFRWLRRICEATQPSCRRVVILRNASRYAVELGVQHAEWLRALHIEIHDYHVAHDDVTNRALPIETFHSKIVCADDQLAYAGSANLLGSSESVSLETGFLVEGQAAIQVARLLDAVLRIARTM